MSHFLNSIDNFSTDEHRAIDFSTATRLPGGGSTCDIYKTRLQRRQVFVKRLKKQYRSKPLYLDALDKEFDIGVSLKHPSLPDYREFHRDYLIIDYIDGLTLADMIKRKDTRLSNEKHIVRMLRELIEVVAYLHRHNVVHCDIKPDNIMITSGGNLILIDFDKCYTDALNDTSGHPGKYGLPTTEAGKYSIDFHAIALLVKQLKREIPGFKLAAYDKFINTCLAPDANCEQLAQLFEPHKSKSHLTTVSITTAIVFLALFIGYEFFKPDNAEAPYASIPSIDTAIAPALDNHASVQSSSLPDKANITTPAARTQDELHAAAKKMAALLDERIRPYFDNLNSGLDRLNVLKSDPTLSGHQLLDSVRAHSDLADEYIQEAFAILSDMFPGLSDRDAWRVMAYSKAYTSYTRRAAGELKAYGKEMDRRIAEESAAVNK